MIDGITIHKQSIKIFIHLILTEIKLFELAHNF